MFHRNLLGVLAPFPSFPSTPSLAQSSLRTGIGASCADPRSGMLSVVWPKRPRLHLILPSFRIFSCKLVGAENQSRHHCHMHGTSMSYCERSRFFWFLYNHVEFGDLYIIFFNANTNSVQNMNKLPPSFLAICQETTPAHIFLTQTLSSTARLFLFMCNMHMGQVGDVVCLRHIKKNTLIRVSCH